MFGRLVIPATAIIIDNSVGIPIAARNLPMIGDLAGNGKLNPLCLCSSEQNGLGDIGWVDRRHIGTVQLIPRKGQRQAGLDVPFRANFIIGEFLGRQIIATARQG